jgi:hypothetical protein
MSSLKFKEYAVTAAWILALVLIVVISIPVTGLVVSADWNWFLAPIAGLRAISFTEGIGLSLFLALVGTIITMPLIKWEPDANPGDSPNIMMFLFLVRWSGWVFFGPLIGLAASWVCTRLLSRRPVIETHAAVYRQPRQRRWGDEALMSGLITLSEVAERTAALVVASDRCERAGRYNLGTLISRHGADFGIPALLALLSDDCPKRKSVSFYDRCGVHCPELPSLFLGKTEC